MNWSKSSLKSLIEGCSWQWALKKVYGYEEYGSPQTCMGTGFHKAIEYYHAHSDASLEDVQEVAKHATWEEAKSLPMSQWFTHQVEPELVMLQAMDAVKLWWEQPYDKDGNTFKMLSDTRRLLTSEGYYSRKHIPSNNNVHGFIDEMYETDDEIVVVDLKTASSFRKWKYDQPASIEAAAYIFLANDVAKGKPVSFEWHVVSPKESKTRLVRNAVGWDVLERMLDDYMRKADVLVELDAFRPRPDWNLCDKKWCAFWQGCQVDGTLSPNALTVSQKPRLEDPHSLPAEVGVEAHALRPSPGGPLSPPG